MSARTKSQHLQALVATAMLTRRRPGADAAGIPIAASRAVSENGFSDARRAGGGAVRPSLQGADRALLKNLLEMLIKGIGTQMGFGNLQNFLIGCSYVLPFTLIYRRGKKKEPRAAASLALASGVSLICMLVVGFLSNLAVAPLFFPCSWGPLGRERLLRRQ